MAALNVRNCVLLAFTCWNCATGCTWMKTQNKASLSNFQVLSTSSINHLEQSCKVSVHGHDKLSMEFPHKQYNRIFQLQPQDHILFILRTLKSIMRIYSGKYEKVDWDQHKLQIFLLDVDRQILELERCAKNVTATELQKRMSKKMEMHFKSLISHLKTTGEMRPVECKSEAENMNIQRPLFPKQEESKLLVLEMSFRNVAELFMKNAPPEWKSSELQQLREFLGQQTQCYTAHDPVARSVHAEVEKWSKFWSDLHDFLSGKSFSSCAWESARTVILQGEMRPVRCKTEAENMKIQSPNVPKQIPAASSADAEVRNWNEFWSELDRYLSEKERCDACDWMISQFRMKNSFCISLLEDMGGEIASKHVQFPRPAYYDIEKAKVEDQVKFLTEATEHIIDVFNAVSLVDDIAWDRRALDDFLNILNTRQLKELKICTTTYAKRAGQSSSEKKLRRHFKNLKKMLKKF
ncbi:interferon a3-like, partial [Clarias magur]